jgi:hypothetical protein
MAPKCQSIVRLLALALTGLALSACATLPNGRLWGQDATARPGWERVRNSAIEAARDPWVWAPLVGAAALQIDHWDRRTSDWAREHTPVFGSQHSAEQWSDDLRSASVLADYISIAATPGGDEAADWFLSKAKGALVHVAAIGVTGLVTNGLKASAQRERPNGQDDESFPSGHTSSSAVHTRLASENLEVIDMKRGTRCALQVGLTTLTLGTAWARVESGWHYPSDTLVGVALGNFIGSFMNDAFLGLEHQQASLAVVPTHEGAVVQWSWAFR